MCGIAGGFAFTEEGTKYTGKIKNAIGCINHRGPDGEGLYEGKSVTLGHKRLSIIDVSHEADQPMYSDDRRFCIIFNGEIFNYKELAAKHFPGRSFHTSSDTEVFLALFLKIGAACFAELRGFFAAAIYDTRENELFLARDRFGKKPIHFYKDKNVLLFASELKQLFAFGIPRELDHNSLSYYLQFNYIPQPLSILKDVKKVGPGCYLKINKDGFTQHTYYELKIRPKDYGQYSYEGAREKLVTLMDEATRLRLISDVPLGAFLSGGIDSSVVVALASQYKKGLNTFSIGYKDQPFFDETHYAKLVAKKYNTEHTVFSLTSNDFLEHIENVLDYIDEPFADSSTIPTYILSKQTRKHVTVALSGDGGDEVFAGYNKYNAEWNAMQPSLKRNLVRGLSPLWKVLPKSRNNKITNTVRQLHRFAEGASLPAEDRYWRWASMMPATEIHTLFRQKTKEGNGMANLYNWRITGNDLNEVLLADMNLVLVGDMLVKVDMMSMANSLEIRSPFLDQEVVEFAFGLPAAYKIDSTMKKRIVQDAFRHLLPPELYNRPKKGFDVPLLGWFRNQLWDKIDKDLLSEKFISEQNIFEYSRIDALKRQMLSSNPADSHETIWALVVFQHWWKKYLA